METNQNFAGQSQRRTIRILVLAIVLVILILGGLAVAYKLKNKVSEKLMVSGQYQAVFLSTGQVYFGKLELEHGSVILSDVYYLQVNNGTGNSPQQAAGANAADPDVKLVKLGSELHGPQDKMYITQENVLFWENLKDDSKVVQAIHSYQSK